MQIDKDLLLRLERLAKLDLAENERETLVGDMQNILKMVEKLEEVDTDAVEPLIYVNEGTTTPRPDKIHADFSKEEALKNAPVRDSDYFKVEKVIRR